jgi:elongation factor G
VPETHETVISGMGERHLEVAMSKLKRKAACPAELARPRIAYRETITAKAEGQGRHKKAVGRPRPVRRLLIRMRPTPRGKGYEFIDEIVGGSIPSKFIPAVEKGIQEASARGVLAGYPMVDFAVELFDGSYHSVDSNEMSFKMAGIQGFKTVAPKCRPVLLEPLDEVEISTPTSIWAT